MVLSLLFRHNGALVISGEVMGGLPLEFTHAHLSYRPPRLTSLISVSLVVVVTALTLPPHSQLRHHNSLV
jgi:hypothetical protein